MQKAYKMELLAEQHKRFEKNKKFRFRIVRKIILRPFVRKRADDLDWIQQPQHWLRLYNTLIRKTHFQAHRNTV